MTKYIIHGGKTSSNSAINQKYFLETINIPKNEINLLIILFARESKVWMEKFEQYKQIFSNLNTGKKINFVMADPDNQKLAEQINQADVIFILGGETIRLINTIKNTNNLKELFQNKTVAGSSAGANFLSKYYYTINGKEVRPGLGILEIKTFPHYDQSLVRELEELKNYKEDLPIYTLPEEKFEIIFN
jgi:peptidase E